ncbi:hypothetical protein PIB30_027383 [Stylosanthes scabra]|uniref:CCHC-type domain-containing protein n=1 Tax=Stylosanthes scabra TaxID=79078 RepID=A0ABU6U9V4_9FABA|nr:hypothetical protein [Stylosanthes scabra]
MITTSPRLDELSPRRNKPPQGRVEKLILRISLAHTTVRSLNIDDYVDSCYKREAYDRCYESIKHPLNGQALWERAEYDNIMPPPCQTPSHRLTKKRRRAAHEEEDKRVQTHLPRVGQIQRCSNCGAAGHKRRGCPKPLQSAQISNKSKATTSVKGKGTIKSTKGGSSKSLSQPPPHSSREKGKAATGSSSSHPIPRSPPEIRRRCKPNLQGPVKPKPHLSPT